MTRKTTAEGEPHLRRQSAKTVQRAAFFDADGRLRWSTVIQPPGEPSAPPSASRDEVSYPQLLQQWFVESASSSGAPDDASESAGQGLGWDVERDMDVPIRTGELLRLLQRRTPDGGALVLLVGPSMGQAMASSHDAAVRPRDPACPSPDAARGWRDAARLAMTESVTWLSQELRTHLNSMLGFAQLMQRDSREALSPRHRPRVDEIVKAGEQVVGVLDGLLELCRAELERVALQIAPTDAREVVEAARAILVPFAERALVELSTRSSGAIGLPPIMVDPAWLRHILVSVGRRAIEQQRAPSAVTIELSIPRSGVVRINVCDDGPGIHPDAQATLFMPLREAVGSPGIEAAGLPLAMAHRLAELMHCQLRFRSQWGQGADFWIDVPALPG